MKYNGLRNFKLSGGGWEFPEPANKEEIVSGKHLFLRQNTYVHFRWGVKIRFELR